MYVCKTDLNLNIYILSIYVLVFHVVFSFSTKYHRQRIKLLVAVLEYFVIRPFCYSDVTCLTCLSFALPHDGGGRHLLCRVDAGVSECSMCHVPYNEAVLPFPIHLSRCAICGLVLLVFFTVASQ